MIYPGGGYKVLLILHLVAVVVAFGPWFLNGMFPSAARRLAGSSRSSAVALNTANLRVSTTSQFAMYAVVVFGFGAVSAAPKGAISMSDGWVIAALVVWVAIIGILHGVVLPAQRALAAGTGDAAALTTRQAIGAGAINVLVVVAIVLMVLGPS